jgi:uncharacterized membrane protein YphA (DoxX/SURF4 family)
MTIKTGGLYAAGAVLLGAIGLFTHDFALQWQPVPAEIPGRATLALLSAAILIIGGLMAAGPKTRAYGAGLLAGFYGLWVVALHLPGALKSPSNLGLWLGVAEILALTAGGAVFFGLSRPAPERFVRLGRLAFGLCPLIFGLSHLVYAKFTAAMVPAWIPPGQLFWAYATGVAHIAGGLAILSGVQARLAATLLAAMFGGFVVLLHLPRVVAEPTSQIEWTMLAIALSLTGAAWIVRSSYATVEGGGLLDRR